MNHKAYNKEYQKVSSQFHSGNYYLDYFLRDGISLDDNYGKTYVLLDDNEQKIIGYYNLGLGSVEIDEAGKKRKIGGAIHINGLALDEKFHKMTHAVTKTGARVNVSDVLLNCCLEKAQELRREHVGFSFVTLSSTEEGYNLYKRNGFEDLDEDMSFSIEDTEEKCKPMYLPLGLRM